MKNIPIPSVNTYKSRLVEKVESVLKRMRWKAFFFLRDDDIRNTQDKHGFRTKKCPPQIEELRSFEEDMSRMIENIKFRKVDNCFQKKLRQDIQTLKKSDKLYIPADKTRNFYKLDTDEYHKLLRENITKSYKIADENAYNSINSEAKNIATDLGIADRVEILAKKQAFITLKDHKENFMNHPTCRLINPTKSELGRVSKQILDNVNNALRSRTEVNQWRNSTAVIEWFTALRNKQKYTFILFDIANFYPSISESLLRKSINFAKLYTDISDNDINIIMHARKSLLFDNGTAWIKRDSNKDYFDVTMGSYDGAEICELVGLYILNTLAQKYGKDLIGLYRDDGLAAFKNMSGSEIERIKKNFTKIFHDFGLKITIEANKKIVNFLDMTLNLNNGKHCPYKKPNDHAVYVHSQSNHPPTIIKHIPESISKRISTISSDRAIFEKAAPYYNDALKSSGYREKLQYRPPSQPKEPKRKRLRNIIWFNPPYSKNVQTNVGKQFLNLITKHFPKGHKLNKIFNKNNVKISYSCLRNIESIVRSHNKRIIESNDAQTPITKCNCRVKSNCPLQGSCQARGIVYNAEVTTNDNNSMNYIGLTDTSFKSRFRNHHQSFVNDRYRNSTELSKHVWSLKSKQQTFVTSWSILSHSNAYSNISKKCNLCLSEKLKIITADKSSLLNKRSELVSKCRHENKFCLSNF